MAALPASLASLTEREAITDALYRAVIGLDTADQALFNSAMTDDTFLELAGHELSGRDAVNSGMYDFIATLTTTHHLSNIRVDVKPGASEAKVTATAIAQHCRPGPEGAAPGAQKFLAGTMYYIDVVKDAKDELWKAKKWVLKVMWREGDESIMGRG